jgi:outer membrane protein assembly factor BamD
MRAYEAGRWRRSAELLTQFVAGAGADARLKPALMALGRSHMQSRDYVLAAADYLRVATEFAAEPEAVQARFGLCQAYHSLSPRSQLDQEYTLAAITYCDSYASLYPATPEAAQAREWITAMRHKLAAKAYQNGFFYFRRGLYDASLVYFNDVLASYPDTPSAPAAQLRLVEAYNRMGYKEEEAAARGRLQRDWPQSTEARTLAAPADSAGR